MAWFRLEADPEGAHCQRPMPAACAPTLDPRFFAPLAVLDLALVDPELAGRKVLCVLRSVGACDEDFEIQEGPDGTWSLSKVDGAVPTTDNGVASWAEPFEEGPGGFDSLPTLERARLVEGSPNATREHLAICTEPSWVQSDESPGGSWRFVARIDSYQGFGSAFVFYDPETRSARHILQFS